ncbi:MAG: type IV pilus biogenesis/stability protein PilW [Woeseia sp.]|nr:type IV pilus biogenesis/stability protein PilW [Woeseia sp.]MBT8097682.1 type IV pilus biogenesis/stability protein PilW [Woeseia sp.]NNE60008.1 type IV pilus biogenesis/stability protein PilW [Woeseia sp.]NNL55583.1 type IV pilus biogenesis/stability protein PilW [Woeseia sp.]
MSTTTGRIGAEPASNEEAANQYYQLGARYFRNGTYELARDRLQRAIELDPELAVAHSTLALTYERLDNMRLAAEYYESAVKVQPDSIDARNSYAVFLCRQRRFDDANKQFERIRRIDDLNAPEIMLTNAGVCMVQKPDLDLAETYFREALDFKPSYGEALLQMTLLKRAQGEHLAARAFLQRYMSANVSTPAVLLLAVQVERDIGDERASSDLARRLLRDFPESPEARRVLKDF